MNQRDVPITYADINKARCILDWKPKVSIEEGVEIFLDWAHTHDARQYMPDNIKTEAVPVNNKT